MSYAELNYHADKYKLMGTAFTLQSAQHQFEEIIKADQESKARLNANTKK